MEHKKEGDIITTVYGYKFRITEIRPKGYSGEYLDGPFKGRKSFLNYNAFRSDEKTHLTYALRLIESDLHKAMWNDIGEEFDAYVAVIRLIEKRLREIEG